jgi:amino acid permease
MERGVLRMMALVVLVLVLVLVLVVVVMVVLVARMSIENDDVSIIQEKQITGIMTKRK